MSEIVERMRKRRTSFFDYMQSTRVPGWMEHLNKNEELTRRMMGLVERVDLAYRDEDEAAFEENLDAWLDCWEVVNQDLAEVHRTSTPPEEWDLRFVRWMEKLTFMKFSSERYGEFFVVPKAPNGRPKAKHWFTAEQMIDLLGSPGQLEFVKAFGSLPVQKEAVALRPGDKHLHVDLTGDEPKVWGEWWARKRTVFRGKGAPIADVIPIQEGHDD